MKLYIFALALLCATSSAVFAQDAETTTIAPTTEVSTDAAETATEAVTTIAPEGEDKKDEMTTTESTSSSSEEDKSGESGENSAEASSEEKKPEEEPQKETIGGRTGATYFPHPQDPRVMFVPQTVRDPVTGMIYHRRVPFGHGHPSQFRPQPQQPPQQPSFDPLGSFNEDQKKQQFFQDLLMTQLSRFEKEVDPMVEQGQGEESKQSLIDILTAVNNLKKILEANQIFNISEIMRTWKEGKLPGQTGAPNGPAAAPAAAPQPEIVERPPQDVVTVAEASPQVRTILLVQPERVSRNNQHPGFIIQRQPQPQHHPLFIRRYGVPQEEQQLPPRGYAPQDQGYIAGY